MRFLWQGRVRKRKQTWEFSGFLSRNLQDLLFNRKQCKWKLSRMCLKFLFVSETWVISKSFFRLSKQWLTFLALWSEVDCLDKFSFSFCSNLSLSNPTVSCRWYHCTSSGSTVFRDCSGCLMAFYSQGTQKAKETQSKFINKLVLNTKAEQSTSPARKGLSLLIIQSLLWMIRVRR